MAKKAASNEGELVVQDHPGSLAPGQSPSQAIAFAQTPENIELLKASLSASKTILTDSELGIFLYQAQKTGLDPLARQIYVMKRDQGGVSFMTSIDGQRLVAQRTGEYDGQTPPQWCGQDGVWKEVWLSADNPAASRVGVYRKGMREPVYGVATWKSYNQGRGTWNKMGDVMLAKCAEALALRKAFPQELSGLYTAEEMNEVDNAPEPPRAMTTQEALAEAGRVLVEKGFSRDEALQIMVGIADVADVSGLTGNALRPVLEIVHREDASALAIYIGNSDDDEDDQPPTDGPQEAEIVDSPPTTQKSVEEAMADVEAADPEPASPRYVVPEYKQGGSSLPRPEMRTKAKMWLADFGLTKPTEIGNFYNATIGKKAPATFDDFMTVLGVLADELNAQAEQGTLV